MSMEEWPIQLYGISSDDISLETTEDFPDAYDIFIHVSEGHDYLSWANNGDGVSYLGLYPSYPWSMIGPDTKEQVEAEIYRALKPYLSSETTEEMIREKCDYINTIGWG